MIRVDDTSLVSGKVVVSGYGGHGILAADIPTNGSNGPSLLFNDISAYNIQSDDEVRVLVTSQPAVGELMVYEDGSLAYENAVVGSNTFTYAGYINGVHYGSFTVTLNTEQVLLAPQGIVSIGSVVDITTSSGTIPFAYSGSDQTGFHYRLNGGPVNSIFSGPIVLNGLTPNTAYVVDVRAYNANGSGNWSTTNFSTASIPQIPQGSITIGGVTGVTTNSATIPFTYSGSDQTGFQYRLDGGSVMFVSANPIVLSSLTPNTTYTVEIRAVNATGNGNWSNLVNFTTSQMAQVPQGIVTIGTIGVTTDSATIPFSYSASDQTGFEYRVNGGISVTVTTNPITLTGLPDNTPYTIEVRAVNATGNGTWSNVANFTTVEILMSSIVSEQLRNNAGILLTNRPLRYVAVYNDLTGELVLRVTGGSTDGTGRFTVEDPSIEVGVTYRLDWELMTGEKRMPVKEAI